MYCRKRPRPGLRPRLLLFLLATLLTAGLSAACGGDGDGDGPGPAGEGRPGQAVQVPGGSFQRITPAELQSMLEDKDFPLINVHIPFEGEIEGTDAHIPYNEITRRLDELPADRTARVVIYCRSGNMSTEAAAALVAEGYTNLYELGGGMVAWKAAGLPLVEG